MLHVLDRHAIGLILRTKEVDAWGVAANDPRLPLAPEYPTAISILIEAGPAGRAGAASRPHAGLPSGVPRANIALDDASGTLVDVLRAHGHAAERVQATAEKFNGDKPFPHKTAATSAGLGWIGKTALFVSPEFGPAVRLATVFTDLELPAGEPVRESGCGDCRECVDACPAGCGRDVQWRPGMARELLFDAGACRHHMALFTSIEAQICGICIAACPLSLQH